MARSMTTEPMTLLRGLGTSSPDQVFAGLGPDPSAWAGRLVSDPGYMATSTDRATSAENFSGPGGNAGGGWLLEIRIPPGSHGLDVPPILGTNPMNEYEFLLAHGSSFLVTSVDATTRTVIMSLIS